MEPQRDVKTCQCMGCRYNRESDEAYNDDRRWRLIQWVVWTVVGALILWAGITFHEEASAAELTDKQAAVIYVMAHSMSGLPLAEKAPTIKIVSAARVQEVMNNTSSHVRYSGAYVASEDMIYLDDALDFSDPYDASSLLHEAVHYLQVHAHGAPTTCEQWAANELQAYGVQIAVIEKAGLDPRRLQFAAAQYVSICYHQTDLDKQGQSERLDNPATDKQWGCFWRQQIAAKIVKFKHAGGEEETFWRDNPLPADWSDAMKEDGRQLVVELYASEDERAVIQRRYRSCLAE